MTYRLVLVLNASGSDRFSLVLVLFPGWCGSADDVGPEFCSITETDLSAMSRR